MYFHLVSMKCWFKHPPTPLCVCVCVFFLTSWLIPCCWTDMCKDVTCGIVSENNTFWHHLLLTLITTSKSSIFYFDLQGNPAGIRRTNLSDDLSLVAFLCSVVTGQRPRSSSCSTKQSCFERCLCFRPFQNTSEAFSYLQVQTLTKEEIWIISMQDWSYK